jgi:HAMP domain-containing protein
VYKVKSDNRNSALHSANSRFFRWAAGLVAVVVLVAIWLVRDHSKLLAEMHTLQTETLSHTITQQKLARNLDELRRQGERALRAGSPEERSQALLIVQLVANSPAFVADANIFAAASDAERFLKAHEAGLRLSDAAQAEWNGAEHSACRCWRVMCHSRA